MYDNPMLPINLIGKGMYHSKQLYQWTSIFKARAIENKVLLIGCSHFYGVGVRIILYDFKNI